MVTLFSTSMSGSSKMKTWLKILVFVTLCLVLSPAYAKTIYMGPSETYTNLASAFAAMSSGDTLIIRAGTYTGSSNRINGAQKPPNGTAGAYTTIQGSGPGEVIFDGAGFDWYNSIPSSASYMVFKNLSWINTSGPSMTGQGVTNRTIHHIKFIQCGTSDQFNFSQSSYMLAEDCWVVGNANYNFFVYCSDHVIFRRCIVRKDATSGSMPMAHFMNYASQNSEFQNCIAIDSDSQYYTNGNATLLGGFWVRKEHYDVTPTQYSTNVKYRGNILLNVKHRAKYEGAAHSLGSNATGFSASNCVFWDMDNCFIPENNGVSGPTYDHMTCGRTTPHGSWPWNASFTGGQTGYGIITNSILVRSGNYALYSVQSYGYNAFYNNASGNVNSGTNTGGNVTTINPETSHLRYLVKVENVTGLDGNDGKKMGAEIIWKTGVDGTLHGEPGYNTVRNAANGYGGSADKLWPWPNQAVIKTFFTGAHVGNTPSKTRGFCAPNTTLSTYILNYLNPTPAIGYANETADINAYIYGAPTSSPPSAPRYLIIR